MENERRKEREKGRGGVRTGKGEEGRGRKGERSGGREREREGRKGRQRVT